MHWEEFCSRHRGVAQDPEASIVCCGNPSSTTSSVPQGARARTNVPAQVGVRLPAPTSTSHADIARRGFGEGGCEGWAAASALAVPVVATALALSVVHPGRELRRK